MWLPFKHFTQILTSGLFEQVTGPVYIFYQFSQYFSLLFCSLVQILKVGLLGPIRSLPMGVAQYTDFTSFFKQPPLLFCSLFQILKVGLLGQIRSLPMGVAQYTDFTSFLNNLLYFFVFCFKY